MEKEEFTRRRAEATEEFDRHENRSDGVNVAGSLAGGLTVLRESLFARLCDDVQRRFGMDSMLLTTPVEKMGKLAQLEIEMFLVAGSVATARDGRYVSDEVWYRAWLTQLRLGKLDAEGRVTRRLDYYLAQTADKRRLGFTNVISSALPMSRKAPLVLFRLVQPAVAIVTAQAFQDHQTAQAARQEQTVSLPSIVDCHHCHGRVLENGEQCPACGNPVWKFEWLLAVE